MRVPVRPTGDAAMAPQIAALASSFAEKTGGVDLGPGRTCLATGEMLWEKSADNHNHYELCYAPTPIRGDDRPTGGTISCDEGSYFLVESPKFCCEKPRIELKTAGKTAQASGEVCCDTLAEFDEQSQKIKVVRGPTSTGTPEQMAALNVSGHVVPSPIAFDAMKDKDLWKPVLNVKCKGADGMAIRWPNSNPPRAELCPPGTTPVGGAGYASWACDSLVTKENMLHCCRVKGHLVCVNRFTDQTNKSQCDCSHTSGLQSSDLDTSAAAMGGLVLPLQSLRRCSRLSVRRRRHGRHFL